MSVRRLPVRPDLKQLQRQAKELLRAIHAGDANAIAEWREHHPESIDPSAAKLADAQFVLGRAYGTSSWTRLVHSVQLADAIWRDDVETVRHWFDRSRRSRRHSRKHSPIFISFRELKPTNDTHREGTSRFSSSVQLRTT